MLTSRRIYVLIFVSNILLGIGLAAPSLLIEPRFGELTSLVRIFSPSYRGIREVSVFGGILTLWHHGEHLLAGFLFLFSVFLPLWKLGVLYVSVFNATKGKPVSAELHLIEWLGKFSLIDVYVLSLLALTLKSLPGGTEVHVSFGLFAFGVSGLILFPIPKAIERLVADRRAAGQESAVN